jgi:hypothetical protein
MAHCGYEPTAAEAMMKRVGRNSEAYSAIGLQ